MFGLIVLVGSSLALWLVLVGLAVARKLRRDRREARSSRRRARYEAALRDGDAATVTAICRELGGAADQVDLAVSIDAVEPTISRAQLEAIGRADAVVLGPGIGKEKGAQELARELVERIDVPLVVVKVLLSDLIQRGDVVIRDPSRVPQVPDRNLLQAVLDGVRGI